MEYELDIPAHLYGKVPTHWNTFIEKGLEELEEVRTQKPGQYVGHVKAS